MKKLLLFIAILISGMGLFAQNIGDNTIIDYEGYSLKFTVTNLEPAECKVYCSTHPTSSTEIVIPSSVTIEGMEFSVTSINEKAFSFCDNLTSIEIPNSVTSIGNDAFYNCDNLTSIEIPNSVTSIGNDAFYNCDNLTSITVEEGNPVYDSRNNSNAIIETETNTLIAGCQNTIIPNSVTSIGNYAFYYCHSLTSIEIPNSVTSIGNDAFYNCDNLTSIEIPNSVTSIGNYAFSSCDNLTSITVEEGNPVYDSRNNSNAIIETETNTLIAGCQNTIIPNSVTSIGNYAFSYCHSLTSIEIPNSVTSIGNSAFYECSNLTSIEIPNSVTSIGNSAFKYCHSLTSIEIPNSVTSIGNSAFYSCDNLTSITVEEGNPVYDSRNNCNAIIETETNTLIAGCQNTIIPNSVTSIGNSAFSYCDNLTSIEIPNSVTSIGSYAFCNCYITSIYCYAENVPETGSSAFYGCPSDMVIYVPAQSVDAYKAASPWNEYTIEAMEEDEDIVVNVGDNTIVDYEGYSLKFTVTSIEPAECKVSGYEGEPVDVAIPSTATISGMEFSVTSIGSIGEEAFYDCENLTSIEIPNTVTSIGEFAFYNCVNLTSIEIPNSVTSIGNPAFSYCSSLTSIIVENGNTVYDSRNNCNAIIETATNTLIAGCKNTVIPNSVTSIGDYAFSGCSSLTSIELPSSVTSIGNGAFSGCSSLTSIIVESGNTVYDSRNNCNAIIETATNTLIAGCKNTVIPNTVTSIGNYAFEGCSSLTSIEIPNGVTSIGYAAFANCSSLTSIEIPSGVTSIRDYAFYRCDNLTNVFCYAENVPETYYSAFYSCPSDMIIYVPAQSVDAYKAASPWNEYTIEAMEEDEDIVVNVGDSIVVDYDNYSLIYTITNLEPAECEVVCSTKPTTSIGITIPSSVIIEGTEFSVTSIGDWAFHNCDNLTSIEISNSVTSIGNHAFFDCDNLTSIAFPNSIESIGDYVINSCPNIESVEIPSSLIEIGNYNFIDSPNLKSIKVDASNPVYDSRNNCNAIIETETNTLIAGCNNTIIPNTVTIIGRGAFFGSSLEYIEIPNNVVSISEAAFRNCASLNGVVFEENSNLKRIESYNASYGGAFADCVSLTSIEIPSSVTYIGNGTFSLCSNLTNVIFEEGSKLDTIGNLAFRECSNLTSIYCYAENVPETVSSAFNSCPSNMVIYVPAQSVDAYKAASPWNNYTIKPIGEIENHWTPDESLYANNMSVIGLIQIDGVNQNSTSLEIGAFCGEEVRGSQLVQYIPALDKYLVFLTIHGDNENDEISFRLYNHETEEELDLRSPEAVTFTVNGTLGSITSPYVLNFSNMVNVTASVNPENAGSISGAGEYAINDIVTLTATSNEGYQFINWTEEGTIVSEESEYSFAVTESRELVANFELLTYNVTANANPSEGGSISGAGVYTHGETATLSATANEGYQFVNWTEEGTIVSEETEYSFTVTESRELVANFELLTYNVTASASPSEGGSISGAGVYTHGETATLSATANEGFAFKNWTVNGNVVSTDLEYSFVVTEAVELVANYNYVHTRELKSGWSWFSSFIEMEGEEGLEMMTNAFGTNGSQIKNQTEFVVYSDGEWYGSLMSANTDVMYMLEASAPHSFTLFGAKVNPEELPISIGTNWRWLAYPLNVSLSVEDALSTIVPQTGDYIKSKNAFSQYYEGAGWLGALSTMNPGEGYMYQNVSGTTKTLVYPSESATRSMKANVTAENNYWVPNAGKFAGNMSVIAVVESNGIEMSDYEIAAFVGDEIRGSARPIYIEVLDKHMIFMTVYGSGKEEITFKYYDINADAIENVTSREEIVFADNATYGSIENAIVLTCGVTGIGENDTEALNVYPNPANINAEISLGTTYDRVEIYNAIGVKIAEYSNVNKIDGIETSGVYVIKVTNDDATRNCRIVVR